MAIHILDIHIYFEVITTSLIKHVTTLCRFFFPVMRTFQIYSLSNFQACNTLSLTMVTMLYMTSPELYFLTPSTHFTHPPLGATTCLWTWFGFFFFWFVWGVFFLDSTYKWNHTYSICLSLIYFTCPQGQCKMFSASFGYLHSHTPNHTHIQTYKQLGPTYTKAQWHVQTQVNLFTRASPSSPLPAPYVPHRPLISREDSSGAPPLL